MKELFSHPLHPGGLNTLTEARHGYFIYNKNDAVIGKCVAQYGEYAELEIALLASFVKPGDVVVEAGGNIGTHTVPLARMVGERGKVISFEAQRVLFQMLCANLALNSITNVFAYHHAVGQEDGVIYVPDIPYTEEANMGAYSIRKHKGKEPVPLVTLDAFLQRRHDERIALIVADVEKMEPELLKGARRIIREHQPIIYMECHNNTPEGEETLRLLHGWDYRVFRHVADNHNPANYAGRQEKLIATAAHNIIAVPPHRELECTQSLREI